MNTFQTPEEAPRASHDSEAPANLIAFMLKGWKPPTGKPPVPIANVACFAKRREALSRLFPGELLVIPTGHLKVRANDTHYPFRAGTDFFYLSGNQEPDCVLALVPEKNGHRAVLFVEPNPGKTDATFYTDRVKGELWAGARLGVKESAHRFGVSDCRPLGDLEVNLREEIRRTPKARVLRGVSRSLETAVFAESPEQLKRDRELAIALSELRLLKDEQEIKELRAVIQATKRGFEDVIRRMKTARTERELEGVFYTRARTEGNDVGYSSIVASGSHACTLHWNQNTGTLRGRDLLLLDAGIEGNSLYTADITRTLPIGGKFSPAQREVYAIVHAAQAAAFKKVKPGNDFMEPNRAAMKVLAQGLEELGILESAEVALQPENQFYKRYSLHNVSHMLGLDVHDCAQARAEAYKFGKLRPGMVLTVEPGLYFQPDDTTVPAKYRGIGVRIEDDVVVTEKGCRNLSAGIPNKIDDVEAWIRKVWRSRPH
jgi:Xaa-Pro aminopeptidase